MLRVLVEDAALLVLIEALLDRPAATSGSAALVKGLPQASPLSPM